MVPYLFFIFDHDVSNGKNSRSARVAGVGRCSEGAEPSGGLGYRVRVGVRASYELNTSCAEKRYGQK